MEAIAEIMTARHAFAADLAKEKVALPLRHLDDQCGTVVDANDQPVFVVDVNRERPDFEVAKIAMWIVLAVNVCGGSTLRPAQ